MSPELTKAGLGYAKELQAICKLPEPERTAEKVGGGRVVKAQMQARGEW